MRNQSVTKPVGVNITPNNNSLNVPIDLLEGNISISLDELLGLWRVLKGEVGMVASIID